MNKRRVVKRCPECGKRMRHVVLDSYQYVESGLPNVYLHGVAAATCRCGEELVQLPKVETLHSLIVEKLLRTARPLRGVEVRFLRKFFAMKAADLAKMLNVDPVTVSRWETGTSPVGSANDKLIRFSILAKASARLKDLAEQAHRAATDAYLDMLSEISALKPEETNDEAMSITSEELEHPRLVFKRTLLPTVHVVTD